MEATSSTISNLSTQRDIKSRQGKKDANISQKLEDITKQLHEVREKRSKLKSFDSGRIYGPKRDYTTVPKKLFSHPKLDYVYGEIMFSPYMTNPQDNYPQTTYKMAETLKEMKRKNVSFKDLPLEEKPYDETVLKRSFIREVCNYNPKFNVAKSMRSMNESIKSSRPGTSSSSSIKGMRTMSSSVSSLKEPAGSRGPLNKLNPRRQPSATSISLDSSGFTPSPPGSIKAKNGLLLKQQKQQQQQTGSPGRPVVDTMAQAMADAVASLSLAVESRPTEEESSTVTAVKPTTVTVEQPPINSTNSLEGATTASVGADEAEYEEDFDQPASGTSAAVSGGNPSAPDLPVRGGEAEQEYEEDFDQPASGVSAAVSDGGPSASDLPVGGGEAEQEYEEDFDQQCASPVKQDLQSAQVSAPSASLPPVVEQTAAEEEVYETDFAATGTLPAATTGSSDVAVAVAADCRQEEGEDQYADEDFEQNAPCTVENNTASSSSSNTIPTAVSAEQAAPAVTVADVPLASPSSELAVADAAPVATAGTPLTAAAATATAPGLLTKSNTGCSSEIPEALETHTSRSTPAPSTVRSDYHPNQIPTPSLSHAGSARGLDRGNSAELEAVLDEDEYSIPSTEEKGAATSSTYSVGRQGPVPSLPVGSDSSTATPAQERTVAVEVPRSPVKDTTTADEPIDEILYVESSGQSAKEGQTRSNNYLQSPVREDIRRGRADSVPEEDLETGDPGNSVPVALSSPVPPGQKAPSDDEIGEEIEG